MAHSRHEILRHNDCSVFLACSPPESTGGSDSGDTGRWACGRLGAAARRRRVTGRSYTRSGGARRRGHCHAGSTGSLTCAVEVPPASVHVAGCSMIGRLRRIRCLSWRQGSRCRAQPRDGDYAHKFVVDGSDWFVDQPARPARRWRGEHQLDGASHCQTNTDAMVRLAHQFDPQSLALVEQSYLVPVGLSEVEPRG